MKVLTTVAAVTGLSAQAYAQLASACPSDACFSLNIPEDTASSGNGDIFFQLTGPSSMAWMALGQGSSMSGSNIFVVYASSSGDNVTLSPRLGTGHSMPQHNTDAEVTLLEGSGISNGKMIANVRCSNCQSWSGGSMDFTSNSASWIHASRSGTALNSDDVSESIQQHSNDYGAFNWDISAAKGGNSVNPFSGSAASGTGSGSVSCVPASSTAASAGATAATTSGSSSNGDSDGDGNGPPSWVTERLGWNGGAWPTEWRSQRNQARAALPTAAPMVMSGALIPRADDGSNSCPEGMVPASTTNNGNNNSGFSSIGSGGFPGNNSILIAHGVLASLAFVIFFPFGAISIRLFSFPGAIWLHGAFQALTYLLYTAAFGLGVYMATNMRLIDSYHPVIGIIVFVLLFFQPILGILHHSAFKRFGRRTTWSHAHLWLGRIAITLGIINGGLGLKLADGPQWGKIAYGVVAGIVWLVWVIAAVWGEYRRTSKSIRSPKYESPRSSETAEQQQDGVSPLDYHGGPANQEYYGNRSKDF